MDKDFDFLFQLFLPFSAVMFCGITIPYMGFIEMVQIHTMHKSRFIYILN